MIKQENLYFGVEFDEIGCSVSSSSTANLNNLLIIPSYKAIVLGKKVDNTINYGIYSNSGEQLIPCRLTKAYSVTSAGVDKYYMEFQGNILDIEQYIKRVHNLDPITTVND